MKKLIPSAAAALIALGLVAGAAGPAMADDAPPAEEPTSQAEAPPAEEAVDAPVGEAPAPEVSTPTEEQPAAEEPAPVAEEEEPTPPVTEPVVEEQWQTLRWTLPNGGTAENVTWPQPVFDSTLIPCGETVTIQVDVYPYTTDEDKARTDALDDDGILTQGEDYGWAHSWSFETYTAPDCAPSAANPTAVITAVCGEATFTLTNPLIADANQLTASFVVNVDDEFYGAYAAAAGEHVSDTVTFAEDTGDHLIEIYQAGTSEWKLIASGTTTSDCVTPPVVEPPVVEPPVTTPVTPVVDTTPVKAAVVTDTLAQTGGTADGNLLVLGVLMLAAGGAFVGLRRFARR